MKALILVNLQIDFTDMGALPQIQPEGFVAHVNTLMASFDLVIAAMHWHPAKHVSFAANHPWRKPGQIIEYNGQSIKLEVMHAVQGSMGAALIPGIADDRISHYVYMGSDADIDTYSCFFDQAQLRDTGLHQYLKDHGVTEIQILGFENDTTYLNSLLDAQLYRCEL